MLAELPSFSEIIRLALRLDPFVFDEIQKTPSGIWLAFAVVVLAAFSESLGQSVVLFLNRVQPRRFFVTLAISTLSNIVGYFVWTTIVWLVVLYVFNHPVPMWMVANVVGLAYAPQLFAFFELTPFFGNGFGVLLSLWSMVAIIVAIQSGLNLATWQAALASGLGWALLQLWRRSLGSPIYRFGRFIERLAAGVPLEITIGNVSQIRIRPPNMQNWQQLLEARRRVIDDRLAQFRSRNIKGQK